MGMFMAPVIAMGALFMKRRAMAWGAIAILLLSLGRRKAASFQWMQFLSAFAMCIFTIGFTLAQEAYPERFGDPKAATP